MYRKVMKRWLSKMLLVTAVLVLSAMPVAAANLLFTAQDDLFNNARLGKISGYRVQTLSRDIGGKYGQGIFPFKNANQERVAVTLCQTFDGVQPDVIQVYDPRSMGVPLAPVLTGHPYLPNIRSMVSKGSYLYGTSYMGKANADNTKARVARIGMSGSTYTPDMDHVYEYTPPSGDGHGEALVSYGDFLYALFTSQGGEYPNFVYNPSKLVKLNVNLAEVASVGLEGKNTDGGTLGATCLSGGTLYIAAWGGSQPTAPNYNPDSMIESVNLNNLSHTTCVTGSQVAGRETGWRHHFTSIVIVGSTAYVQAVSWNASWIGGEVRLYAVPVNSLGSLGRAHRVDTVSFSGGWRLGMVQDGQYLWMAAGKNLRRYTLPANGSANMVFGPQGVSLGGNISSFMPIPSLRSVFAAQVAQEEPVQAMAAKDEKDGGSGCDAGFSWLLLLAVVPVALRRRG